MALIIIVVNILILIKNVRKGGKALIINKLKIIDGIVHFIFIIDKLYNS